MAKQKTSDGTPLMEEVKDGTTEKHGVDNASAGVPTGPGVRGPQEDSDETKAAQKADADRRAEGLAPPVVEAELSMGVDPVTGGEIDHLAANAVGIPVMVPEGKGDIRSDVTWPTHVQAPPVSQVAPEALSKANSSTSERNRAAKARK